VELTAESAYVWDVTRERALYSQNADATLPLASITKLMTALLAYELVPDETPVAVSYAGILQQGQSGLATGERFTARDLADLALIASSNDAAYSLASAVGERLGDQDPTAQFVAAMNIRAEELGFETLEFTNPTGLDRSPREAGAYGSAREVSFLVEYILESYPDLLAATTEARDRIYNAAGEYHAAANTNALISEIPNLLGSKTGYTDLAGGNLTVAFDAGFNRPIVVTVLGSTRSDRFTDVATLVDAARTALSAETDP
jgi:D-alanyl-D-alanine carboxypeptidase (penicillin-binding protein 5/6)